MTIGRLITTEYEITSVKIGKAFDGFTFAYLADLHDICVGKKNALLLENVEQYRPDAILLGGDMITEQKHGRHETFFANAASLIMQLSAMAPVYYSIGNHEERWKNPGRSHSAAYSDFREMLEAADVRFLDNRSALLHKGSETIRLTGLSLPLPYFGRRHRKADADLVKRLIGARDEAHFQILLAHSPTHHKAYDAWGADLTLSGHYHGGQVRLPILGGVISTGWDLFPKYDMGLYEMKNGKLIVSAGLGTHTIPLRINNPPEICYITLRKA